jgi:hypothetical protein
VAKREQVHDVARQDAGYEFCEVQGKGERESKRRCRQRAWTQTDAESLTRDERRHKEVDQHFRNEALSMYDKLSNL